MRTAGDLGIPFRVLTRAGLPATALLAGIVLAGCGSSRAQPKPATPAHTPAALLPTRADQLDDYDDDEAPSLTGVQTDKDSDDRQSADHADNDRDSTGNSYYDPDDRAVLDYGRAAEPQQRRAILALVRRYEQATLTANGAAVCKMIDSRIAAAYPVTLGEAGPRFLHGLKSCSALMSRLFQLAHGQLALLFGSMKVDAVRVSGQTGLVVLALKRRPARQLELIRQGRQWRLYSPVDEELP